MRGKAVFDSGVIFAIFFEEAASERAARAAGECRPITLDLAVSEVGNAAWKRVAFFQEREDAARLSRGDLLHHAPREAAERDRRRRRCRRVVEHEGEVLAARLEQYLDGQLAEPPRLELRECGGPSDPNGPPPRGPFT